MRIVVAAATYYEVAPFVEKLNKKLDGFKSMSVEIVYTGVGLLHAAVHFTHLMLKNKPDFIIQGGIAGCFDETIALTKVMAVSEEIIGDMGVEENNTWKDLFDLGLNRLYDLPFHEGKLVNKNLKTYNLLNLDEVVGLTVNEITTSEKKIALLKQKYHPVLESMEGAALHYAGNMFNVPFLQIRSVSNYIGERDKSKWKMTEARNNLNKILENYVDKLENKFIQ